MKTISKILICFAIFFISLQGFAANFCPETIECKIVAPNMQPLCAWPMGWSLSAILVGGNINLNGQTIKFHFTNAQYNTGNSSNCNYSFSNSDGFYNLALSSGKKADVVLGSQWKPGSGYNINYCWDIAAQATTPHDSMQCPFID